MADVNWARERRKLKAFLREYIELLDTFERLEAQLRAYGDEELLADYLEVRAKVPRARDVRRLAVSENDPPPYPDCEPGFGQPR